jgi:hypothetical protein
MKRAFVLGCLLFAASVPARALDANDIADMDQFIAGIKTQLPLQMGASTWTINVYRDGARMHFVIMAKGKAPATREWREQRVAEICRKDWESLERGWKFSDTVVNESGTIIAQVFVEKDMCPPR